MYPAETLSGESYHIAMHDSALLAQKEQSCPGVGIGMKQVWTDRLTQHLQLSSCGLAPKAPLSELQIQYLEQAASHKGVQVILACVIDRSRTWTRPFAVLLTHQALVLCMAQHRPHKTS